nr:winged helix DNA-binding protein [Litorivivens lipolytica]
MAQLLEDYRESALGVVLVTLVADYEDRFLKAYGEQGFSDIRRSHGSVLRHLDASGTTLSELALRAGVSKQAIGKTVRQLEALGYLHISTSHTDKRARLVRFSLRGDRLVSASNRVVENIRRQYRQQLGSDTFQRLFELLQGLTDALGRQPQVASSGEAQRFLHFGRLMVELAGDFEKRLLQHLSAEDAAKLSQPVLSQFFYCRAAPMTVSELAENQPLTVQAVSLTSRAMVKAGLLAVRESPRDSRAKELSISERGWNWLKSVVRANRQIREQYAEALGQTALEELDQIFRTLLKALVERKPEKVVI